MALTPPPTYDDAKLILRLYELRREPRMREARQWFVASFHARTFEEFQTLCPIGSRTNQSFRMVTTYWDLVASFITAGVLNRELFFESGRELLLVWERFRDLYVAYRAVSDDPMLSDLAAVGEAFAAQMKARTPDAYEAFSNRVREARP
jgi:hypothetical protein